MYYSGVSSQETGVRMGETGEEVKKNRREVVLFCKGQENPWLRWKVKSWERLRGDW